MSKVYVSNTRNIGKGIFAKRNIKKKGTVFIWWGKEDWIWNLNPKNWHRCLQVDFDRYIEPFKSSPGYFINHSCNPNCGIVGIKRIVAMRNVKRNEEITIDYSTNVGWRKFRMRCKCRSKGCRKIIRSFQFLPMKFRKRYRGFISNYLLTKR